MSTDLIDQQHVLEMLAKHLEEDVVPAPRKVEVIVIGSPMGVGMAQRLCQLGRDQGLDIIIHTAEEREVIEAPNRTVLLEHAVRRRDELADLIRSIDILDDWPEPTYSIAEIEPPTTDVRTIKKQPLPKLAQFMNNQRSKGPSTRRQFALNRPPRRGGR